MQLSTNIYRSVAITVGLVLGVDSFSRTRAYQSSSYISTLLNPDGHYFAFNGLALDAGVVQRSQVRHRDLTMVLVTCTREINSLFLLRFARVGSDLETISGGSRERKKASGKREMVIRRGNVTAESAIQPGLSETGQRRAVGALVFRNRDSFTDSWCALLCRMRISKPGSGLKLAPFGLPLSLFLPVAPPRGALALSGPLRRTSAPVGVLRSPGCSLALSHPQCAHRTRPGRKSFPLRRADHARFFVIDPLSACSTGDRRDTRARVRVPVGPIRSRSRAPVRSSDARVVCGVIDRLDRSKVRVQRPEVKGRSCGKGGEAGSSAW